MTLKVCWAFLLNYIEALKMAYFLVFYLTGLIHVICFIKAPVICIQVWNRNNKSILATCIALDWFINVFFIVYPNLTTPNLSLQPPASLIYRLTYQGAAGSFGSQYFFIWYRQSTKQHTGVNPFQRSFIQLLLISNCSR